MLSRREKIILSTTISVIIFSMVFNFLILPILSRNEKLNKEINITKTRLKKYMRLLKQKEYLQDKYNKLSLGSSVASQQSDALVNLLSELEKIARNAQIKIIDIRPENTSSMAHYKEISVDLKTEGSMEGYSKFIYDIENSLLLLNIKKFQLNTKSNTQILEGFFSILQLSLTE